MKLLLAVSMCAVSVLFAGLVLAPSAAAIVNEPAYEDTSTGNTDPPKRTDNDCRGPLTEDNCGIMRYIKIITQFLSAAVGVIVVIMLIVGGIQYSTAGDNPQSVQAAKQKIKNSIIAMLVYIFALPFLNWLIPGGLF